jgi:hypothetical protein
MTAVMPPKRRLPVLQTAPDEGEARPAWQWALLAAGLTVLVWLILTLASSQLTTLILRVNLGPWGSADELAVRLAAASQETLGRIAIETVLLQICALSLASLAAGLVLGVWGPLPLAVPAAIAAGLVAVGGVVFAALSAPGEATATVTWGSVLLVPTAAAAAYAGARLGARRKRSLPP